MSAARSASAAHEKSSELGRAPTPPMPVMQPPSVPAPCSAPRRWRDAIRHRRALSVIPGRDVTDGEHQSVAGLKDRGSVDLRVWESDQATEPKVLPRGPRGVGGDGPRGTQTAGHGRGPAGAVRSAVHPPRAEALRRLCERERRRPPQGRRSETVSAAALSDTLPRRWGATQWAQLGPSYASLGRGGKEKNPTTLK